MADGESDGSGRIADLLAGSNSTTFPLGVSVNGSSALLQGVTARPIHLVVKVDVYLPGCPPSADLIHQSLVDLIEGRTPDTHGARFGR